MNNDIKHLFLILLDDSDEEAEKKVLSTVNETHTHSYLASSGDYLIHLAAQRGMVDLVLRLIQLGANPYSLNNNQENALSLAYKHEQPYAVIAIFRCNTPVTPDIGPFFIESVKNQDINGLKLYCTKAGAEVVRQVLNSWVTGEKENSMLHVAAKQNDELMVDFLLSQGANPAYRNKESQTAFDLITDNHLLAKFKPICPKSDSDAPSVPHYLNPYQDNYREFAKYVKSKKYQETDYADLGAVVLDSPAYYFNQGDQSKAYARALLARLWSHQGNRELARKHHDHKVTKAAAVNPGCTSLFPSCLSFVVLSLKSKEYCLVGASIYDDKALFSKLSAVIRQLNQEGGLKYILSSSHLTHFNELMVSLMGTDYVAKPCAEKSFSKTLVKLFLIHGKQLAVKEVCNVFLYPYNHQEYYGNHPKAEIKTVRQLPPHAEILSLFDDFYTPLIPCCQECQKNKSTLLDLYKGSQDAGQDYLDKKQPRRDLSPLRHSIKTNPDFFEGKNNPSDTVTHHYFFASRPLTARTPVMQSGLRKEPKKMPSL